MIQTVLIIDDSLPIHTLIREQFVGEPCHFLSAFTGTEGLAIAELERPDLVLLDVDLPDINGFDVCRHLAALPAMRNTPVVFLTASASPDEKVCGLQLEAADYITKPFDPSELHLRIRSVLRTGRLDVVPISEGASAGSAKSENSEKQPIDHRLGLTESQAAGSLNRWGWTAPTLS